MGRVAGAAIGTAVEPGGGTLTGAGIGTVLGAVVGFGGATAGTVYLTNQAHNISRADAQLDVARQHIGQIQNLGPDDEDPEGKTRDWTKHAQKALSIARKYAGKVRGKSGETIRQTIDELAEQLENLR